MNFKSSSIYANDIPYTGEPRTLRDAQMRNRFRWRIRGMALYHNLPHERQLLTEEELRIIHEINVRFDKLRKGWTENTKRLGFKVGLYTCNSCGKHSNKEYLFHTGTEIVNLCKRHFKEFE